PPAGGWGALPACTADRAAAARSVRPQRCMSAADDNSRILRAALEFAAAGWPVFPCSPNDKRPLVGESAPGAGDAGLYRATTDPAQIRSWWGQWPQAMIGVPTGAPIGAFVIDLDPKDGVTVH